MPQDLVRIILAAFCQRPCGICIVTGGKYAVKRRPSNSDLETLRLMRSVVVGAVVIKDTYMHDQLMYLRAKFQRFAGSSFNSESFHLIDPDGCIGQELSIFIFRSS